MTRPAPLPADRDAVFAHWPNRITGLRFLGALVLFVLLALVGEEPAGKRGLVLAALLVFVAVAASDALDGWIARRYGTVTAFGRIADPFVDKILVVGALVQLVDLDWPAFLPAWIVVAVVAREFLVTGIRGYVESAGAAFPADWFGKLKMIVQCVAIGALLAREAVDWGDGWRVLMEGTARVAVWATLVTAVGSGASYALKARRILGGAA